MSRVTIISSFHKKNGTRIELRGTAGGDGFQQKTEETGEEKMTKRKGYIPTTAFMMILAFGSTIANAGIIIGGRAETAPTCETTTKDTVVNYLRKISTFATAGIIIGGRASTECTERNGIIIGG